MDARLVRALLMAMAPTIPVLGGWLGKFEGDNEVSS